jgi:hypothetical protein
VAVNKWLYRHFPGIRALPGAEEVRMNRSTGGRVPPYADTTMLSRVRAAARRQPGPFLAGEIVAGMVVGWLISRAVSNGSGAIPRAEAATDREAGTGPPAAVPVTDRRASEGPAATPLAGHPAPPGTLADTTGLHPGA